MSQLFPERFDFEKLNGARATQFAKREDAFQQLVGDGLISVVGHHVAVAPTKGRDGSIDAFVEQGCQLGGPFKDLPAPLIVECKDHDDKLGHVADNILAGWKAMEGKLKKQAKNGWPDLFAPWKRATAYAYCVSAFLPDKETREKLQRRIENFFNKLPKAQRPPIASIRVIGWHELRHWLNGLPRVSDEWLGVGIPAILDHEAHLARLTGFRKYLRSGELQFVVPDDKSTSHPRHLLTRLGLPESKPGIILVGGGGVGKTRTSLEVASLAADEGWRVLHLQPGQPAVTVEDIAQAVLSHTGRILLVFDYLDQMQYLDLGAMRRRVLPEAAARGSIVALLANSRPGWLRVPIPERDDLFAQVPIRPDADQSHKIIEVMTQTVAPTACSLVGLDEVIRLCGQRPIIALLIAQEIERRARGGTLRNVELQHFRSADLNRWLRQRLAEPPLSIVQDQTLLSRPPVPVVAVAAALACAPGSSGALTSVASSTLTCLDWDRPEDANRLVALLLELGWLEPDGTRLSTAHDVVADEVIAQVIQDGISVRERELEAVLSAALQTPASLGRFAVAFRRVLGATEQEETVGRIQAVLGAWLRKNAATLSQALPLGEPDPTGYALGAMLAGPPWDDLAIELWDTLIGPWLLAHGDKKEARHLLYIGLRGAEAKHSPLLLDSAMNWLAKHGLLPTASFVAGPLLRRTDLGERTSTAINHAFEWLGKHGDTLDAGFVLPPLLGQKEVGGREEEAIKLAFEWLGKHGDTLDAGFVLAPLLGRRDLAGRAKDAIKLAFDWLGKHGDTPDAGFVIAPLLGQKEVGGREEEAIKLAFEWLGKHGDTPDAGFVIAPLLGRTDLAGRAKDAIKLAFDWLGKHGDTPDAGFVIAPLLGRKEVGGREEEAIKLAFDWLGKHGDTLDAEFVLNPLLGRRDLAGRAKDAIKLAFDWLGKHEGKLEAQFVLNPLLERTDLAGRAKDAIKFAFDWLGKHGDKPDAGFVLNPLLGRKDLREQEDEALNRAEMWLVEHATAPHRDFVFNRILRKRHLPDSRWQKVAAIAVGWLDETPVNQPDRDYALYSLLARPEQLTPDHREKLAQHSLNWLRGHVTDKSADRMPAALRKLLRTLPKDQPLFQEIQELCDAVRTREDLKQNDFRHLVKRLNKAAVNTLEKSPTALIKETCASIQTQASLSPGSAAYAIAPLLALGCRVGGESLDEVKNAVAVVLKDERLTASNLWGIAAGCHRLLGAGAFPSQEEASELFREFDLEYKGITHW